MDDLPTPTQDDIRTKRAIFVYFGLGGLLVVAVFLLLIPNERGARNASRRSTSKNNLKQIGLAFHNYHDAESALPDEVSGHSWATHLLPYLDQAPLYTAMDLSKPWDDVANEVATKQTVQALDGPYDFPRHNSRGFALSHYAGNSHWLNPGSVARFSEVSDGMSNTILAGEVGDGFMPWAQPGNLRDPSLGFNTGSGSFGHPRDDGGVQFLLGDGSVRYLSKDIDPAVLKALSTPAGGETLSEDY